MISSGISPYDVGTNKDTALLTPNSQASHANLPPTLLPATILKAASKEHYTPTKSPLSKKTIKIFKGKIVGAPNARTGNTI